MKQEPAPRYASERKLEDAILRMARTHAEGIATADLMDLTRDVVDAVDACRASGTTHDSVTHIIEDTFGSLVDKEEAHAAIKHATATTS